MVWRLVRRNIWFIRALERNEHIDIWLLSLNLGNALPCTSMLKCLCIGSSIFLLLVTNPTKEAETNNAAVHSLKLVIPRPVTLR